MIVVCGVKQSNRPETHFLCLVLVSLLRWLRALYTTVRGVYNHKLAHIDSRVRSWCVMVCRDRSTDVRFCHPFRSLFADFRRFSPLKAHIDPLTTQISKCYTSTSFCPIKILSSMIDSKFQRKQNILLRFSIFAIKKKI